MKNQIAFFSIFFTLIAKPIFAQETSPEGLKWYSIQEALEIQKTAPKKLFIDMYTNWCGWCKKMDATTFKDSAVMAYLKDHFYPVKMNAEMHDSISYKGKQYGFRPDYKAHELAAILLNGQMSYPTAVYLDEQLNLITPVPGYMTPQQILPILKYFGEDFYKTKTWEEYNATQSK